MTRPFMRSMGILTVQLREASREQASEMGVLRGAGGDRYNLGCKDCRFRGPKLYGVPLHRTGEAYE